MQFFLACLFSCSPLSNAHHYKKKTEALTSVSIENPKSTIRNRIALIQLARDRRHLQLTDRHRDLDLARAGHRAVEGRVAARQARGLSYDLESVGGILVAAVEDEAVRIHQSCRTKIIIAGPEGRAGGGASRAQDALCRVIKAFAVFLRLDAFLAIFRNGAFVDEVRQDLLVVVEEGFHVYDQVFDDA